MGEGEGSNVCFIAGKLEKQGLQSTFGATVQVWT